MWQRVKHVELANFLPTDVENLREALVSSLERTRGQRSLLRSFIRHAKLRM